MRGEKAARISLVGDGAGPVSSTHPIASPLVGSSAVFPPPLREKPVRTHRFVLASLGVLLVGVTLWAATDRDRPAAPPQGATPAVQPAAPPAPPGPARPGGPGA